MVTDAAKTRSSNRSVTNGMDSSSPCTGLASVGLRFEINKEEKSK